MIKHPFYDDPKDKSIIFPVRSFRFMMVFFNDEEVVSENFLLFFYFIFFLK